MTKNTRVKWKSQERSCLDYLGSDIMFFIHKWSERMLTILPPGYAQTPIRLIHDFKTNCKSGKLCRQFPE